MGSWNATCGVSQLPIQAGDTVKAFLLIQHEWNHELRGSGTVYNTEYFRPWFFPVTASYNSYGSIENIKNDWNSQYMLKSFQRWLKDGKIKILDNEECEINSPEIDEFKTLDDVFDCVERGAVLVNFKKSELNKEKTEWISSPGTLKVGLFMVLNSVFEDLVTEAEKYFNSKNILGSYYKKDWNEIREKAIDASKKIRETTNLQNSNTDPIQNFDNIDGIELVKTFHIEQFLCDMMQEHKVFKHYISVIKDPSVDLFNFFEKHEEIHLFCISMMHLRKMFIPQTGSQSEGYNFYKKLAKSMLSHIKIVDEERKASDRQYRLSLKKEKAKQLK
jgi:hypothetical protein